MVTLAMSSVIMIIGTVICLAVPGQLMGLFTSNAETVLAGKQLSVSSAPASWFPLYLLPPAAHWRDWEREPLP